MKTVLVIFCCFLTVVQPKTVASLEETWQNLSETPEGIIDHLVGIYITFKFL